MNRVPTIEELMRKPPSELRNIFQKATLTAAQTNGLHEERNAARLTLVRVAICLRSIRPHWS